MKDWIVALADAIQDEYGVDTSKESARPGLVDLISEHCPFKSDVAYMLVPRCGACKHWNGDTHRVYGICAKVIELDGNLVSNDFGCVQWEAR